MFILYNESGNHTYSDVEAKWYDTKEYAIDAIHEKLLHKPYSRKLYAFLKEHDKFLFFPGGTSWNVYRSRGTTISANTFKSFTQQLFDSSATIEGYWMLINLQVRADNKATCFIAPLNALIEKDYASISKLLRTHTIDNILKEI